MAYTLSRVDRIPRDYNVSATNPDGSPATITAVAFALLPVRSAPTAATVWTSGTYAAGSTSIVLAGPDADSSGAIVIPASCDLWWKVTYATGVDTEKVERLTLLGGGATIAAPIGIPVISGTGAGGALSGTYPNPGLNETTVDSIIAGKVGAVGSATDVALKANSPAEVWDRFTDRPDGPMVTPKAGKPYTLSGGLVGATALPRVAGGKLTYVPAAGGAGYASVPVNAPLRRVGGRFSFGAYTTNIGSVGLLGWAADVAQTFPVIPDSPCHFIIGPTNWAYSVVSGNTLIPVASGNFATPLTAGTVYTAEAYIDRERSTAYLFLPDGSVQVVSHALIGSVQATYAGWELYRETATDAITAFHSTWADSNSDSPMARVERAAAAQGAVRALAYAPAGASDVAVPTSLADIDATNLKLPTFIAPNSGRVLVEFTGYVSMTGAGQLLWGIANGGASLGVQTMVNQQYTGQLTLRQVLTVSAGSSYSLKWQHFCTTGSVATFKLQAGSDYVATMTVTPLAA